MPVRAVLFDLFDTLVDLDLERLPRAGAGEKRMPSTVADQHRALTERGHEIALDDFAQALRECDRELYRSHLAEGRELPTRLRFSRLTERLAIVDEDLPEILTRTHMAALRSVAVWPEHHADVLRELAGVYAIGICSNFSHAETAHDILRQAGLAPHLAAVTISETVGIRKPRSEIFRHALEGLGATPEETVHVGDTLDHDVRGASALGLRTVWARRRVRDPERALREYDGPRPTWVVEDLAEIAGLLGDPRAG